MCRIYGFMGAVSRAERMPYSRDAQIPGGPDHQHYVTGDNWALGCNRLAIQDPTSGFQPFSNREGTVFLAFNGEVYNFRQIRERLRAGGVEITSDSDGSVLLPLYLDRGDDFVDELHGMYAIAVVDLRGEPCVKLWSDPLGIKGLYYVASPAGIAFASEVAGLEPLLDAPLDVDPFAIDAYFDMQCPPNGTSLFDGVRHLLPGERLSFAAGTARTATPERGEVARLRDDDPAPALLLEHLKLEVARMSLQAAPIAVQASGGLDSSVLLTLLRRERPDVTAFHVTYKGTYDSDERAFALDAAKHAGVGCEVVEIDPDDLPALIPDMVTALGSPNAAPHSLSADVLFREISARGFRVCFVGDGADEQLGGYRRYTRALESTDATWMTAYLDRLSIVPQAEYRRLFTRDYRAALSGVPTSRMRSLALLGRPATSRVEQLLEFDRLHKLPCFNLRKLDHLSMAHSVEGRVPYCQPSITRFARSLPEFWKVDGARRKRVLFETARGLVPESVLSRPKQPFTLPVEALLAEGSRLWEFTVDVILGSRLYDLGYLERGAVERVVAEHRSGGEHARLLWAMMVLELSMPWHRPAAPARHTGAYLG